MYRTSYVAMILSYCGVHGYLTLLGVLALLIGALVQNRLAIEFGAWFSVLEGGATIATIVAMFRPGHLAKILAALHSTILALVMLALIANAYQDFQQLKTRYSAQGVEVGSFFSLLTWSDYVVLSCQALVIGTALTALFAAEVATAPSKEGNSRKAKDAAVLRVLALAISADGAETSERIAVAVRRWSQYSKAPETAAALEKKLLHASQVDDRDQSFRKAVALLKRTMLQTQRDWLVSSVTEICQIGGPIDPLAEGFLTELKQQLDDGLPAGDSK